MWINNLSRAEMVKELSIYGRPETAVGRMIIAIVTVMFRPSTPYLSVAYRNKGISPGMANYARLLWPSPTQAGLTKTRKS